MWGANSESSGTTSIPGVDGPANGVTSDAVSNGGGNPAGGNYGPGSAVAGGSGSAAPSIAEEKKKKSKAFWKGLVKKSTSPWESPEASKKQHHRGLDLNELVRGV